MFCRKRERSLKIDNSSAVTNSLLESQIKDLQDVFLRVFFFFGGRKLCNGLADTATKHGLKFKISCAKLYATLEGKRYTYAQGENVQFWKNLFPLREMIAYFRIMKKRDTKFSPTEFSLIMSAHPCTTLCVRGFNLQHGYLPHH